MRPSYSLDELVPHRGTMRLIDEVVDVDEESQTLVSAFKVRPDWNENIVAIEFMAQTAAALAGYFDQKEHPGRSPRPGFLLGTRRFSMETAGFEVGRRYFAKAVCVFADSDAASFDCSVMTEDGTVLATAVLNAYRPPDMEKFMREQRG